MSPNISSWKVVEPSSGMRWRMTKLSPAAARASLSSLLRLRQGSAVFSKLPSPSSCSVWEQKQNFFYDYPELVAFRDQARAKLGL